MTDVQTNLLVVQTNNKIRFPYRGYIETCYNGFKKSITHLRLKTSEQK